MTIVAFHHTKDDFFVISDGLISRGPARVLEQTQKIIQFTPQYKIPQISVGRLNGFTTYIGGDFCLCFAGNYSIISNVINKFSEIVSRKLVLDRDDKGTPTIYQREDEGKGLRACSYWDNYNFSTEELIPITVNFLVNILQRVTSSVCADFSRNAMQNPDIELLLFGEQIVGNKREKLAQVLKCKEFLNEAPVFSRFSVLPWTLTCVGDPTVIPALIADVESDSSFNVVAKKQVNSAAGGWLADSTEQYRNEAARTNVIEKKVLKIIQSGSLTIGGNCAVARSGWATRLSIKTIKHDSIDEYMLTNQLTQTS